MNNNKKNIETKNQIVFSLIGVFILILAVFGISYAVWNYSAEGKKENVIKTGSVLFSYKENEDRYINLENAEPISDSEGIELDDENSVFEFNVSAKQKGLAGITYYIYAEPDEDNTLSGDFVKLYLTDKDDKSVDYYTDEEIPVYNKLGDYYCGDDKKCKLIYKSDFKTEDFSDDYKLRIWLSSEYSDNESQKNFAFKVNVKGDA